MYDTHRTIYNTYEDSSLLHRTTEKRYLGLILQ